MLENINTVFIRILYLVCLWSIIYYIPSMTIDDEILEVINLSKNLESQNEELTKNNAIAVLDLQKQERIKNTLSITATIICTALILYKI